MNMETLFRFGFWSCLACIVIGMLIGLASVWLKGYVSPELIRKLTMTDGILFGGSLLITLVSWFWLKLIGSRIGT